MKLGVVLLGCGVVVLHVFQWLRNTHKGKVLSNQPNDGTTDNGQLTTYVSNGRPEPIVASGYIWIKI